MIKNISDDLVIVLAGEAGQGIQVIERILSYLIKRSGYHFFSTSEFMSRVRGGSNSTEIRVSSKPAAGFLDRIDILIALHEGAVQHLSRRITSDTVIIGEKEVVKRNGIIEIPFAQMARELGNAVFINTIAAGLICALLKIDREECENHVSKYFSRKNEDARIKNIEAAGKGYSAAAGLTGIKIDIKKSDKIKNHLLMTGADAIALGAIAGGCNYVCGYPMSPSTSVLENMAGYSTKFDIIVEQVEDEVGVINMALGAWYTGARALVTTSGGGFALMCEGVSLCGMIESPLVLHLAQRPGPATGLPTRTEQGDLNLALYAGHGVFPRIILAPGTVEDGFQLTQKAFNIADRYQVPVFILTDQFFVDSMYDIPELNTNGIEAAGSIVKTDDNYKRFLFTESGISPRGIPGYGSGNVCVDSDEHDERGYITEDHDIRVRMVDKRLKKNESIQNEITPPELSGKADYKILVICWGSTFNTVKEAVELTGNESISVLHFSWVYPLHAGISEYIKKASVVIIVENNASAQFAQLIKLETGYSIDKKILKYNGLPFSVEEVKLNIEKYI